MSASPSLGTASSPLKAERIQQAVALPPAWRSLPGRLERVWTPGSLPAAADLVRLLATLAGGEARLRLEIEAGRVSAVVAHGPEGPGPAELARARRLEIS